MWARRLVIGSGLAVASLLMAPNVAGAANIGCYTSCAPPNTASVSVSPNSPSGLPFTAPTPGTSNPTSTSSLPFTGADIEGLAVAGVGAVLAGGLLLRRRRSIA